MNHQPNSVRFLARRRREMACALLGLSLGTGAWANSASPDPVAGIPSPAEPPAASEPAPDTQHPRRVDPLGSLQALSRYLTPADMADLSRFMFAVVLDLIKGTQEASLPPDLAFKLAVLEQRFQREGNAYMQQVLRDIERDLRRWAEQYLPFVQLLPFRMVNGQ